MNRWLLIWNIVLTVLMVGMVVSGCASIDPQFSNLVSQVTSNRAAIEQLASAVNEDRKLIASQGQQILTLQMTTEANLKQITISLQEYVKEYVKAQVKR